MIERSSSPPPCLLCACPGADVTNYHKPGDLKPHRFLILQSWRPHVVGAALLLQENPFARLLRLPDAPVVPGPRRLSKASTTAPSPLSLSSRLRRQVSCLTLTVFPPSIFFFNFSFRTHFSFTRVVRMTQSSHIFFLTDFPILTSTITELRLSR